MNNDLISRSDLIAEIKRIGGQPFSDWDTMGVLALAERIPAVEAVEVCRCKDCELWDREHKEMHQHSTEHPEVQAEFAECRKWSTWSTCMMLRADDFCSQAERRADDAAN